MRKYLIILFIGVFCINQSVYGEEADDMTFEMLVEKSQNDAEFQIQSKERIKLLDVNSDGIISYNEITNAATSVSEIPENLADDSQKEEMKGHMLDAFEDCDKDLNNELSGAEIEDFADKMRFFLLKQRFDTMDKNGDGIVDVNDMPNSEESMQQMEDAIQQMKDLSKRLDEMDAHEVAQNWIKNIGSAVADEDYYQMDKDQNGCVSREEYVDYQMRTDRDEEEEDEKLGALDYSRWYLDIKKENPDCLSKDEYIKDQSMSIEERLEKENTHNPETEEAFAGLVFDEMDSDLNGKLTATEYAEYNYQRDVNLYAPNEPVMKQENYYSMFLTIKAPDKGWMSKEEFVADYMAEEAKSAAEDEEVEGEEKTTPEALENEEISTEEKATEEDKTPEETVTPKVTLKEIITEEVNEKVEPEEVEETTTEVVEEITEDGNEEIFIEEETDIQSEIE